MQNSESATTVDFDPSDQNPKSTNRPPLSKIHISILMSKFQIPNLHSDVQNSKSATSVEIPNFDSIVQNSESATSVQNPKSASNVQNTKLATRVKIPNLRPSV